MKKRFRVTCLCVSAMLLLCGAALGEILDDGYWDGYDYGGGSASGSWMYSSPTAWAGGSYPYSWADGDGSYWVWTTEAADCTAYYNLYCWAEAKIDGNYDENAYAYAIVHASGHINGKSAKYKSASAYADFTDPNNALTIVDSDSKTDTFSADTGFTCSQDAAVVANVTYGLGSTALAHGCTRAEGSMYTLE